MNCFLWALGWQVTEPDTLTADEIKAESLVPGVCKPTESLWVGKEQAETGVGEHRQPGRAELSLGAECYLTWL